MIDTNYEMISKSLLLFLSLGEIISRVCQSHIPNLVIDPHLVAPNSLSTLNLGSALHIVPPPALPKCRYRNPPPSRFISLLWWCSRSHQSKRGFALITHTHIDTHTYTRTHHRQTSHTHTHTLVNPCRLIPRLNHAIPLMSRPR